MSPASGPVSIHILDKEYLIACPPEERDDLRRRGTLLNVRLREIREGGKVIGTERQVMMAALNMANELSKLAGPGAARECRMGAPRQEHARARRAGAGARQAARTVAEHRPVSDHRLPALHPAGVQCPCAACGVRQADRVTSDPN